MAYNASNPTHSSMIFPDSSAGYLNGVNQCDAIVHNFHKILLAGNANLNEAENYFHQQQIHLQEQIQALDELQTAILEEKRCLESQLHECKTQVQQARNQKRTILTESDQLMQHLTQELAHLADDESQLQTQHEAVDDRIDEMKLLTKQLDDQIAALNREATEARQAEQALSREERATEEERNDLRQLEYELEERLIKAERQDEAITMWTRNLDAREGDSAKVRQLLIAKLKEIEHEEQSVGINGAKLFKMDRHYITLRSLVDDFEMHIERDVDCEEIDTHTDEE